MIRYIFDGSFEGLLTAIYEAYYRHEVPQQIVSSAGLQTSLVYRDVSIPTDADKADKVYHSIISKISPETLEHCYHTYLSEIEGYGTLIYNYLRLGWKVGPRLNLHLADEVVLKVHKISQKVAFEVHKMTGLLRFMNIHPTLYFAPIEPDHNITALLAPHFAERMSDQDWIIYDVKRKLAAVYDRSQWIILSDIDFNQYVQVSSDESLYQDFWKRYFDSIAIKNRRNPKLQRQHMPARYWKYLVEKQGRT